MRVLLTGASGTIGGAIKAYLESCGHDVHAPSHAEMDVTDVFGVGYELAGRAYDALILAHGTYGHVGTLMQSDPLEWKRALDVNLLGCVTVIQAAEVTGPIVIIAGGAGGKKPLPERSSYACSKAAVNALVITGAAEGLNINAIAPGPMHSKMQEGLLHGAASEETKDEVRESLVDAVPVENTLLVLDYLLSSKCLERGKLFCARDWNHEEVKTKIEVPVAATVHDLRAAA